MLIKILAVSCDANFNKFSTGANSLKAPLSCVCVCGRRGFVRSRNDFYSPASQPPQPGNEDIF